MTYKRHWLLSWGGTLAGGLDIWANNIRFTNDEAAQPDNVPSSTLEVLLDDYVNDIRTMMADARNYISVAVTCKWVKFNQIDELGHYADPTNTHARYLTAASGALAPFGGVATTNVPPYQSVAISTTTDRVRGPGSLGRYFLPQCAPPLNTDGRMTTLAQGNLRDGAVAFLNALGDEAGVDVTNMRPAVVSNVGAPGPAQAIKGVRVGNVPDVIRRRKNAILESYVAGTLA